MSNLMKSKTFIAKLKDVVEKYKTVYVQGVFGAPMVTTPWDNIKRYTVDTNNKYNLKHAAEIQKTANKGYFGFDCVCLVKGILWGWSGNANAKYGGAAYNSNGVPDIGTEKIIGECSGVSTTFNNVMPGELLWKNGHVGVYIGDGLAVECTPSYKGGAQITAVKNIGTKSGYYATTWTKHGKLPYVDYTDQTTTTAIPKPTTPTTTTVKVSVPVIKQGTKSNAVKAMQALLNMRSNAKLEIDGSCGAATTAALKKYQAAVGMTADGSCGAGTWTKLING